VGGGWRDGRSWAGSGNGRREGGGRLVDGKSLQGGLCGDAQAFFGAGGQARQVGQKLGVAAEIPERGHGGDAQGETSTGVAREVVGQRASLDELESSADLQRGGAGGV